MNLFGPRYREWLVPYVEGTLDARRRAKLEARLALDPVLAAEAEVERRVAARLREAAPTTGEADSGHSLWPAIQARLEPRRPSVRPLILVGGLSAATATLVGAALWGPLRPSTPASPRSQIASRVAGGDSSVVIVVSPPGKLHRHPGRRHSAAGVGKRPTALHALPIPAPGPGQRETPPQDRLASGRQDAPDAAVADGGETVPKFTKSGANFRLTTNEHPDKGEADPNAANPDTSGNAHVPPEVPGPAETPPAHADGAATSGPSASPAPSEGATPKPHRRRHHRRHGRMTHTPSVSTLERAGTAPVGTEATTPAKNTPSPPKAGTKPVD